MDWNFVLLPVLLLCSAIFSMSETALFSLPASKADYMLRKMPIRGKIIKYLLDHSQKLLVTNSACNTTVNILATLVASNIFETYLPSAGPVVTVITMTILVLIIGEVTPKTIAIKVAQYVAPIVAPMLFILTIILTPITFIFQNIAKFLAAVTGLIAYHNVETTDNYQNDEMIQVINQGQQEGVINKEEGLILRNVISFADADVHKIMRPTKDIFALQINTPLTDAVELIREKQYSRIPVYGKNIDDITGILYARDLNNVPLSPKKTLGSCRSVFRKPFFVPATMKADTLFAALRKTNNHIAIAINEYGEVCGLVTMEDIFENIVGDVIDKDDIVPQFHKYSPDVGEFSGDMEIDEFNAAFETDISAENAVTLAGYVLENLRRIPEQGEIFSIGKLLFKINQAKPNKIEAMRVSKIKERKKEQLFGIKNEETR